MTYTVGDQGTTINGQCLDNTEPVNLTGCTVELHLQPPFKPTITRTADITDAPAGRWSYTFADGDLTDPGGWRIEAQVTDDEVIQTFGPASFSVRAELG